MEKREDISGFSSSGNGGRARRSEEQNEPREWTARGEVRGITES